MLVCAVLPLGAAIPQAVDDGHVSFNQLSQEVRLASPKGGFLDYVVGAYYLRAKTDEIYRRTLTRIVAGAPLRHITADTFRVDE